MNEVISTYEKTILFRCKSGDVVTIDKDDWERLKDHHWWVIDNSQRNRKRNFLHVGTRLMSHNYPGDRSYKSLLLTRAIMEKELELLPACYVHHKNSDRFDFRKENLYLSAYRRR